jgi:hypothetical protein
MKFKLKTKGFSMDINFFFNWVFYGVSIEKKNPRRQSPQGIFRVYENNNLFNIPIWSYVKVMSCGVYHLGFLIDIFNGY